MTMLSSSNWGQATPDLIMPNCEANPLLWQPSEQTNYLPQTLSIEHERKCRICYDSDCDEHNQIHGVGPLQCWASKSDRGIHQQAGAARPP